MSAAAINRLRRLAVALREGGELPADDRATTAAALERYLARAPEGERLDQALGIGGAWWLAERDQAIRDAASLVGVRALDAALRRYAAGDWRADRVRGLPTEAEGSLRALLFTICSAGGKLPRLRQLYEIVGK